MKNKKQHRRITPFTLIEVVVVIVILVTLAGIATPLLMKNVDKSKLGTAKIQIKNFETALDNYKLDVGTYPSVLQCLVSNLDQSDRWNGPYLKTVPKDPWGNEYIYEQEGQHNMNSFDLYSWGPDGQEGGEGDNAADITNWTEEEYGNQY
jgi:general secretion pathway protein G